MNQAFDIVAKPCNCIIQVFVPSFLNHRKCLGFLGFFLASCTTDQLQWEWKRPPTLYPVFLDTSTVRKLLLPSKRAWIAVSLFPVYILTINIWCGRDTGCVMSFSRRFPSSIPHQAERSCPPGGGSSHTQLFASRQPPPTHHLDERYRWCNDVNKAVFHILSYRWMIRLTSLANYSNLHDYSQWHECRHIMMAYIVSGCTLTYVARTTDVA